MLEGAGFALDHLDHGFHAINSLIRGGTLPIVISYDTFLWHPPNSTINIGVDINPGLTLIDTNNW